jgi:hypothetical protein
MYAMSLSPAVCPRCSTPFQCGVQTGACWCKDVSLSAATREAFAQYYDGCLCPDCLKTLDEARPPVPSVRSFLAAQLKRRR